MMRLHHSLIATLAILAQVGCGTSPQTPAPGKVDQQATTSQPSQQPDPLAAGASSSLSADANPTVAPRTQSLPSSPVVTEHENASSESNFVTSAQKTPDREAATAQPIHTEEPKSPYAGLKAEEVSFLTTVGQLLSPIKTKTSTKLDNVTPDRELASAILSMANLKITLDQQSEKRIRTLLSELTELDSQYEPYARSVNDLWVSHVEHNASTTPIATSKFLASYFEKAIDSDVEFTPGIRAKLTQFLRRSVPTSLPLPLDPQDNGLSFSLDATKALVARIRDRILSQTLTGTDIFYLAMAIHSRGKYIVSLHDWMHQLFELIAALPQRYQFSLLFHRFYGGYASEYEFITAQHSILKEHRRHYHDILKTISSTERTPENLTKAFTSTADSFSRRLRELEQIRQDQTCNVIRIRDEGGWRILLTLNSMLDDLNAMLLAANPDLSYRFSPLFPPSSSRDPSDLALPRLPATAPIDQRVPLFTTSATGIKLSPPTGMPTLLSLIQTQRPTRFTLVLKTGNSQTPYAEISATLTITETTKPDTKSPQDSDLLGIPDQYVLANGNIEFVNPQTKKLATVGWRGQVAENSMVFYFSLPAQLAFPKAAEPKSKSRFNTKSEAIPNPELCVVVTSFFGSPVGLIEEPPKLSRKTSGLTGYITASPKIVD